MERFINEILTLARNDVILIIVIIAIMFDTVLGLLRAIKEHKFNSCVGIDGAIRKVAMLISLFVLLIVDELLRINIISFTPEAMQSFLASMRMAKIGICEFFALLFITYETVSILKNATLCGIWLPKKVKEKIYKWLENMTGELPNISTNK